MTAANFLPFLLLYLLFNKQKPKPVYHAPPVYHPPLVPLVPSPGGLVPIIHPSMAPAPWPVAMPAGLPPFPGPGWVPDSPPPAAVVARAVSLLPQLWGQGQGAHTTEQTGGRWITYLATMIGSKRSVVAYRLSTPAAAPPAPMGPAVIAPMPPVSPGGLVPAVYHPDPAAAPHAVPAASPAGPVHIPAAPAGGLPVLRLTHPNTKGPSVVYLQRKLGISDDGTFGTGTDRAVRAFQQAHGLKVDGVVGRETWAALG